MTTETPIQKAARMAKATALMYRPDPCPREAVLTYRTNKPAERETQAYPSDWPTNRKEQNES